MSIVTIKNERVYQGLDSAQIYKQDIDNNIFQVFLIPNTFPIGKSYFLIYGSDLLKQDTDLKIEILDSKNKPIYYEIPYYEEAYSRAVSVWIDSDTANGIGSITILGELQNVPDEWKGHYNVKWKKSIHINNQKENDSPIKFINIPSYNVKEVFKFHNNLVYTQTTLNTFNEGKVSLHVQGRSPNDIRLYYPLINFSLADLPIRTDNQTLELTLSGSQFTSDFLNAKVYVTSPNFSYPYSSSWDINTHYTGTITYIQNQTTAHIQPNPVVFDNNRREYVPVYFNFSDYEIKYLSKSIGAGTIQSASYFEFDFNNLTTFSGKVHSVRINKKSKTAFDTYTPLGDFQVDSVNLLISQSTNSTYAIGEFNNIDDINSYWTTSLFDNYPVPTVEYNNSTLFGSVKLSNSKNYTFYPEKNIAFHKSSKYTVSLIATTKISESSDSVLEIYASGSAFINNSVNIKNKLNIPIHIGKLVGILSSSIDQNFNTKEFTFNVDNEASGTILFAVKSGYWYIRDIYVYPYDDDGYNPDSTIIYVPNNSTNRNEAVIFKVDYINGIGNIASDNPIIYNPFKISDDSYVVPTGSPSYITGFGNVLTGSLVVGDQLDHGIEISSEYGAYVRSLTYSGFNYAQTYGMPGFMIYSGSVLPGTSDNYHGVGLELHAGYNSGSLKFVANGDEAYLQISGTIYATDGYFSGILSASSGYIGGWQILSDKLLSSNNGVMLSGSGVISSSNFYINESGDLTASNVSVSGFVSASSGQIGGWQILDNALSSSYLVLDGNGSRIYKADDPSNYFIDFTTGGGTGYYVKFGPNFMVQQDGILIASGAIIEGSISASSGYIGGWFVVTQSLYHDDGIGNITGMTVTGSDDDSPRFFAGSDGLNYSDMQNAIFNVKSNGDITGSQVLFTGGKIGGWTITDTIITSSNIVINSNGSIYTSNYESNNKGWIITSALNGFAEFENVKVRGTLSTTVFEKDTVNAIGGQIWIANSTTLSSSISSTENTWSVKNASGFAANEILIIKALNPRGFTTEYVLVESSSLTNSDTGEGYLYVLRAYSSGTLVPISGIPYIDFSASTALAYSASQVIASTGKSGSGYIRINANPNDPTTPYIDIIERTGSGIYDLDLKNRIGDLSGLSPSLLYGDSDPGFGFYTTNGYLKGAITARTGSFIGIVHAGNFNFGLNVSGSNDGIYLNKNNYWYDDGNSFKVGDDTYYALWDGSAFYIKTPKFYFGSTNQFISGSSGNIEISSSHFHLDNNGDVDVVGGTITGGKIQTDDSPNDRIVLSGSSLSMWKAGRSEASIVLNLKGSPSSSILGGAPPTLKIVGGNTDVTSSDAYSGITLNKSFYYNGSIPEVNTSVYMGTSQPYYGIEVYVTSPDTSSFATSFVGYRSTMTITGYPSNSAYGVYSKAINGVGRIRGVYGEVNSYSTTNPGGENIGGDFNANGLSGSVSNINYGAKGIAGIGKINYGITAYSRDSISGSYAIFSNAENTLTGYNGPCYSFYSNTGQFYNSGSALFGSDVQINGTLLVSGSAFYSASLTSSGSITPALDNTFDIGSPSLRWKDLYVVETTVGGIFESGLKTENIGDLPTGTLVIWKDGKLEPSYEKKDQRVIGVIKNGKNEPIILGAEYILVTGKVNEGDYIVSSNKIGHGISIEQYLFKINIYGKIIAQALESCENNESTLIKAFIKKL